MIHRAAAGCRRQRRVGVGTGLAIALGLVASHAQASPSDVGGPGVSTVSKLKMTLEYSDDLDRTWVLPKLAYSRPLAPTFEAEIAISHMRLERATGADASGVGDVEFKGKWALLEADGWNRPGVALEPKLIVAAGADTPGLGVRDTAIELPILIGWSAGSRGFYTKAGYRHGFSGDPADRRYMGGVLGTWQRGSVRYGLDVTAELPTADHTRYRINSNLGLNWYLSPTLEIQALVGTTLRHPVGRDAYKAKFVIEYKFDGRG